MRELPRDYINLAPTILSKKQCHLYLKELVDFISENEVPNEQVASALSEMVTRFSDNYIGFGKNASEKISRWAKQNWANDSPKFVDTMLSVLAYLDENIDVIGFVKEMLVTERLNSEVKSLLYEFVEEMKS